MLTRYLVSIEVVAILILFLNPWCTAEYLAINIRSHHIPIIYLQALILCCNAERGMPKLIAFSKECLASSFFFNMRYTSPS